MSRDNLVTCKYCGRAEWWGRMIWLSGKCMCRKCYKEAYERENGKPYTWDDLDGDPVPGDEQETTKKASELKPCPFCGGPAALRVEKVPDPPYSYTAACVQCTSCSAKTRMRAIDGYYGERASKDEVIEAWNRRA